MRKLSLLIAAIISVIYLFLSIFMILSFDSSKSAVNKSAFLQLVSSQPKESQLSEIQNHDLNQSETSPSISGTAINYPKQVELNDAVSRIDFSLYTNLNSTHEFKERMSYTSDNSSITCRVQDYKFTEEEALRYWNFRSYGECTTNVQANISIIDNILSAKCENGQIPLIHLDERNEEVLGGKLPNPKWVEASSVDLGKSEYALIKCDPSSIYAYVFSRFDESVSKKAKTLTSQKSINSRPLGILLLVLDSVSKDSANRNLKNTMKYLQDQLSGDYPEKYSVYDFDIANSVARTTRENMVQILYGQNVTSHEKILKGLDLTNAKHIELQKKALWGYFNSIGYVTYFSFDTIYDYLSKSTGRLIKADHVFNNFWRVAKKVYGYHDHLDNQRCLGEHNAHFYSMNYTYQFFDNYKNHNRFGYAHITAAHEDTGNIRTVDDDLKSFLGNLFQLFNNDREDLVVFLIGDHGRGNHELEFDVKGYFENMLPMTFVIMNKELEERLGSEGNLKHNSKRLMSRYDINLSLKTMGYEPFGGYNQEKYQELKKMYPAEDVVSIFHEKISDTRGCSDIGVQDDYCICKEYKSINFNDQDERKILNETINIAETYMKTYHEQCEDIKVVSINSAKKFSLKSIREGWDTLYFYDIQLQLNYILHISAIFIAKSKAKENASLKYQGSYGSSTFFMTNEIEILLQISEMRLENQCTDDLCIINCWNNTESN